MTRMVWRFYLEGMGAFEHMSLSIQIGYIDDCTIASSQDAEHQGRAKAFMYIITR